MRKLILLLILCAISIHTQAQKSPVKFGAISMEDMNMASYPLDSSAEAVVLVDYGEAYLSITSMTSSLTFERHIRIKILKKEGLKWADASIPLYHQSQDEEKVISLKASTYNLENGKIIESKMSKEGVFKEKFNRNFNLQKFTLPNVKQGSVIEYSYKITSGFVFNFPNWEFQKKIPVIHSEYWAMIPEFFIFEKYMQGYLPPTTYEVKNKTNVGYSENGHHWVMKNAPAFKEEPFMTTEDDYISKVNFALSHINFPGQPTQEIMGSWKKLNDVLLEDEDFGQVINRSGFLKDQVGQLTLGISEPLKKIDAIHKYVRENIEWDGTEDKYADNLKKVLEKRKGTSADINLMLGSMLDKAGFDVVMVMLSTRDHGFVRISYPMAKQFNYVICGVRLDGKTVLLDATEKYLPMDILPERCLNGQGLVISKTNHGWIEIAPKAKSKTNIYSDLTLSPNGDLKGSLTYSRYGYDAHEMRKDYFRKNEETYLKDLLGNKTWQVEKSQFENMNDITKQTKEEHKLVITEHASVAGDVIYINPFLTEHQVENPFKVEKREYPVDFGTLQEELYTSKIMIPDGFVVDEIPQSRIFTLPGNAAKYSYSANLSGNVLSVSSSFQINKSLFIQDEYPNLREFYNQVIAKQAEQIVLKKK